jgi:hypothetical protein
MTSETHAAGPVDQGEWLQTRPGERLRAVVSHPDDSTLMHHQNEDEHCLVLEGVARIVRGDGTFDAPAGRDVRRSGWYDRCASEAHPACLGQRDGFDAPDDFDVLA